MLTPAFNLQEWIDKNRHLLKPPVGNKCIVDADYIVMIVGGPNERTDYHYEDGPEFFYQIEGEMILRIQEDGKPRDIPIKAGEMFYLPPHVPHSPQRMPDSVGLVIERKRLAHEQDALMWFCECCNTKIFEEFFHLIDIENQFHAVFERFYRSVDHRTCKSCGHLNPAPARYLSTTPE
jgi:3-hydroxyanthranilate 3,4-dioxygenase